MSEQAEPLFDRPWLLTRRERLPSGQTHVEILASSGARIGLILEPGDDRDEIHQAAAEALIEGRRIVKGRRVGDPR